ncbi:MAG: WecB/TagA/CpsF family glycosyltransferase, partial [Ignavibacteriae bacterium]|nr:WecB/TagA/CpsF family glycosyltransferase [Ignavibacteriota bacterium]
MNKPIIELLGTKFSNITNVFFSEVLALAINKRIKTAVSFPNVYICSYAQEHRNFIPILNQFDLIIPDGIGVYLASRFLYWRCGFREKIVSTDIWFKLFSHGYGYKYYFIGGAVDCKAKIENKFADTGNFNIVGSLFKLSDEVEDLNIINNSNADILMVALGTPNQEEWIIKYKNKIDIPVIIAVGSGLDFLAGVKNRAPTFMRNLWLEWFY